MSQPGFADNARADNTFRLFIGIACPHLNKVAALLEELRHLAIKPGTKARIVPENNLHITLKFLGSVQQPSIARITATLDQLAVETHPFVLTLARADSFRDALWLGVDTCEPLMGLVLRISELLEPLGFQSENRPFIPHLTLARLKQKASAELQAWWRQHQHETWGDLRVREIHLYKSATLAAGPEYSILHTSTFNLPD